MNMFNDAEKKLAANAAARGQADQQKQAERGQYARAVATELNEYLNDGDSPRAGQFELAQEENVVTVTHKRSKDSIRITALERDVYALSCDTASLPNNANKGQMTDIVIDWLNGNAERHNKTAGN